MTRDGVITLPPKTRPGQLPDVATDEYFVEWQVAGVPPRLPDRR